MSASSAGVVYTHQEVIEIIRGEASLSSMHRVYDYPDNGYLTFLMVNKLRFPHTSGVCWGITCMALDAMLRNNRDQFNADLKAIKEAVSGSASAIQEPHGRVDLGQFFTQIAFNHMPWAYSEETNTTIHDLSKTQKVGRWGITPKDEREVRELESYHCFSTISGMYHFSNQQPNEYVIFLETLKEAVQHMEQNGQSIPPFGLMVRSGHHVIAIGYHPDHPHIWNVYDSQPHNDETGLTGLHCEQIQWEESSQLHAYVTTGLRPNFAPNNDYLGLDTQLHCHANDQDATQALNDIFLKKLQEKGLLEQTRKKTEMKDALGETWLMRACHIGNINDINILLENGADINAQNKEGYTALHWATQHGPAEVVQFLLAQGADVTIRNKHGRTALDLARERNDAEVITLLLERDAALKAQNESIYTPLHLAAKNGDVDTIRRLLNGDANIIHVQDNYGYTALHLAAQHGNAEVVALLLQHDVDVNSKESGYTALHLAVENGHIEVVRLLLENNADLTLRTAQSETAAHIAAKKDHAEIIILLWEAWYKQLLGKLMATASHLAARKMNLNSEDEPQYNKDYEGFKEDLYFLLRQKHGEDNEEIEKIIAYSVGIDCQIMTNKAVHDHTFTFFHSNIDPGFGIDKREKQNVVTKVLLHLCDTDRVDISDLVLNDEERNALRDGQLNALIKNLDGYDRAVPRRETACIAM